MNELQKFLPKTRIQKLEDLLKGSTWPQLYLSKDKMVLVFLNPQEQKIVAIEADGDCCSDTWFDFIENETVLQNSPVLSCNDKYEICKHPDKIYEWNSHHKMCQYYDHGKKHYGFDIITLNGIVNIEYRNESNGYYGGSFACVETIHEYKILNDTNMELFYIRPFTSGPIVREECFLYKSGNK